MRTVVLLSLALVALATPATAETREHLIEVHELGPGSYHLAPTQLTGNVGDTVAIVVVNPEHNVQSHDLVLCGDAIDEDPDCEDRWGFTPIFGPGEQRTLVAKLERAGTFEYYCSIPGHKTGTPGMRGTITVQSAGGAEAPGLATVGLAMAVLGAALLVGRR